MSEAEIQRDQHITAEIKLYYDLLLPQDLSGPAPLLIAVHGYGAHKRYMMREARQIAPEGFIIASVEAPHQHFRKTDDGYRVGFGWLTDHRPEDSVALHHRFLLDLIDRLSEEGAADPSKVYLYGFSQACALNFRFALTYPDAVRAVIGVCGGIPGDLEASPLYKPYDGRVLYLYGDDDEWYTNEQFADYAERLGKRIPNTTSRQYHAGHEITEEMRADLREFLAAKP
ncbi:MAG: hypothetical protein KF831_13455 [Acidobacteria bacterium]|nr:hypothetical protein [Acidobacteriota bacterium]